MITDIIVLVALLYLFGKGWSKGFFKTLLGPLSLVLGCVVAYVYYQQTRNLMVSLAICIIGPFVLTIIVSLGLKIWHKATLDKPPLLPLASKILGSLLSVLWGGGYLVLTLLLIGMLPVQIEMIKIIQYDVKNSRSYELVSRFTSKKIPGASYDLEKIQALLDDPVKVEQLQSTAEFKELAEDERLIEIFSDEKTAELMRNKNYTQLLADPDIQAIFQDQDLLKKLFALNKKIMEESMQDASESTTDSQPKIIEVK